MAALENEELSLWKVGEKLDYSQCNVLGQKLDIQQTKRRNIYAKVQRGICTQEEMNFEILHTWMANQTPHGNPMAYLQDILVKDFDFSKDDVQEIFRREHLLYESATERLLGEYQLYQIAENVNKGLHIPLILRLGLTFTKLQHSRQKNGGDPVQSLFEMLCWWQKDLSSNIDQLQSMCNILEVSGESRLAYSIRENTWGVENNRGEKSMLCAPPGYIVHKKLGDTDLHINPLTVTKTESLLKFIVEISERIPSHSDLSESKLQEMFDECRHISKVLSNIQMLVGMQQMYELFGFTLGSFFLHVGVLSDEGLARLKEDMKNGSLASRLEKVLNTYEASRIFSQIRLAQETTDQPIKNTARGAGQKAFAVFTHKDKVSAEKTEGIKTTLEAAQADLRDKIVVNKKISTKHQDLDPDTESLSLDSVDDSEDITSLKLYYAELARKTESKRKKMQAEIEASRLEYMMPFMSLEEEENKKRKKAEENAKDAFQKYVEMLEKQSAKNLGSIPP